MRRKCRKSLILGTVLVGLLLSPFALAQTHTLAVLPVQGADYKDSFTKQIAKTLEAPFVRERELRLVGFETAKDKIDFSVTPENATEAARAAQILNADTLIVCELRIDDKRKGPPDYRYTLASFETRTGDFTAVERGECERCNIKRVRDKLGEALTRLLTGPHRLTVLTEPEGAEVFMSGQSWGVTPVTKKLPQGQFPMVIKKESFQAIAVPVVMPTTHGLTLSFTLRKDPNYLPPVSDGALPPALPPVPPASQAQPSVPAAPSAAVQSRTAPAPQAPATAKAPEPKPSIPTSAALPAVNDEALPPLPGLPPASASAAKPAGKLPSAETKPLPVPIPLQAASPPGSATLPAVSPEALPPLPGLAPGPKRDEAAAAGATPVSEPTHESEEHENTSESWPVAKDGEVFRPGEEAAAAPTVQESTPLQKPAAEPPMSLQRKWAWRMVGLCAGSALGGVALTLAALSSEDRSKDRGFTHGTRDAYAKRADAYWISAYAVYGLAGAALVTALPLFFTEPESEGPGVVQASAGVTSRGAFVQATVKY